MTKKIKSYLVSQTNAIVIFALFALSCSSTLYASNTFVSDLSNEEYSKHSNNTDSMGDITDNTEKDEVLLVVSGAGATKEDATKAALRCAIELTFGTFVSSNTNILNDNIIKDEIVTISSGNIKSYKYISANNTYGNWEVTIQAVVSINKLVSYTKQKGGQTELAGNAFAMDVKLKRLYKQNEETAFNNLIIQLEKLVPRMFDYSINVESPIYTGYKDRYSCDICITMTSNNNYKSVRNLIWNTIDALCLKSEEEITDYKNKGMCHWVNFSSKKEDFNDIDLSFYNIYKEYQDYKSENTIRETLVYFRSSRSFEKICALISSVMCGFIINDGLNRNEYYTACSYESMKQLKFKNHNDYQSSFFETFTDYGHCETRPEDIGYRSLKFNFPIANSVIVKTYGSIDYTIDELEKIETIKVENLSSASFLRCYAGFYDIICHSFDEALDFNF